MSTCALVFLVYILYHFCFSSVGCSEVLISYKKNPAPDGHRCGVCPTYFQKICAFDMLSNATMIFDNHCVMDLYNCIKGTEFSPLKYKQCIFFGNFGYVHGYKHADMDYGEDHFIVKGTKQNPDFVRRVFKENMISV